MPLAALVLTGGCGSGTGDNVSRDRAPTSKVKPSETPTATGVVLSFTGSEYAFTPPTLKASAGPTTIRFTNGGAMEHDLIIDSLHVHLMVKPGETAQATVTLKAGTYKAYCSIPGHKESGMHGTLTVS